jgi:hypothetical protein
VIAELSLLFYTANRIPERFAAAVRQELLETHKVLTAKTGQVVPIICVSHKPLRFGIEQICVGDVEPSIAQVYRNVLVAAKAADTPFVAFCEDDTLYVPEHFIYRPEPDVFAYNEQRAVITRKLSDDGRSRVAFYYFRPRTQLAQGICHRELLIDTLEERFRAHPTPPLSTDVAKRAGWGEPGRYEKNLGLAPRKLARFKWTLRPNVTFNHGGLMGRRRVNPDDVIVTSIDPWGDATALWNRIHGA